MITIDPQQELFTRLKIDLEGMGQAVYDGFLPPPGTPYPFVYLGDFRQTDMGTKTQVNGMVYATIHVWSNTPKSRGTVSKILLDIKRACRRISQTDNFAWAVREVNQRIMPDSTTTPPLLHGMIEAGFFFS